MAIVVRYPGRACLLGEHNDWAGGASLAIPVPLHVEVTVEEAARGLVADCEMDGAALHAAWEAGGEVTRAGGPLRFVPAAAAALRARGVPLRPAHVWARSTLPTGRGFSSSAAFSLSVLDGLARHAGLALEADDLAELAFHVEHDLLGVACGRLDPLACSAGAPVLLVWNGGRAPLRRVVPRGAFHLVVGAFPRPRDTRGILSTLNALFAAPVGSPDPAGAIAGVRTALAAWGAAALEGARALEAGRPATLGAAMDRAQRVYETELCERIPEMRAPLLSAACAGLREKGALGAKFSGAGGDGSVIALFPDAATAAAAREWLAGERVAAWLVAVEDR